MDQHLQKAKQKLNKFWKANKRLPSFSEMTKLFNYSSKNSVAKLVIKLKEAEIVNQDSGGRLIPGRILNSLPFTGSIQAGFPSPAEEELETLLL